MFAAQVNARKHEKLRMALGFDWSWGLGFCEALLGWVVIAAAVAGRAFGLIWTGRSPPHLCVLAGAVGHPCIDHCVRTGRRMDARRIAIVFGAYGWCLVDLCA